MENRMNRSYDNLQCLALRSRPTAHIFPNSDQFYQECRDNVGTHISLLAARFFA
jgi:hypothetical protein